MKCKRCGHTENSHTERYSKLGYCRDCPCPGFVPADSEAAIKQALGKEGEK